MITIDKWWNGFVRQDLIIDDIYRRGEAILRYKVEISYEGMKYQRNKVMIDKRTGQTTYGKKQYSTPFWGLLMFELKKKVYLKYSKDQKFYKSAERFNHFNELEHFPND